MKKIISLVLALCLTFTLAACGGKNAEPETTAPVVEAPASALEALETVWANYSEDERFAVFGGSMAAPVDGAPGSYDITDENITFNLLIPADQLANVTEAASMIHMMNANTFTCAAFKLADGVAAADFGAAMKDAVMNNQWICGFPELLSIREIAGAYVLVAFGAGDLMSLYQNHLTAAYPGATVLTEESIA